MGSCSLAESRPRGLQAQSYTVLVRSKEKVMAWAGATGHGPWGMAWVLQGCKVTGQGCRVQAAVAVAGVVDLMPKTGLAWFPSRAGSSWASAERCMNGETGRDGGLAGQRGSLQARTFPRSCGRDPFPVGAAAARDGGAPSIEHFTLVLRYLVVAMQHCQGDVSLLHPF